MVVSLAAVITLGAVCLVKYLGAPCRALSAASMCSSVVRSLWYSVQYMNLAHKMMIFCSAFLVALFKTGPSVKCCAVTIASDAFLWQSCVVISTHSIHLYENFFSDP